MPFPEFRPGVSLVYEHRSNPVLPSDPQKLQIGERLLEAEPAFQQLVLKKLKLDRSPRPRTVVYTQTTRSIPSPETATKLAKGGRPVPTVRYGMGFMQLTPDRFAVFTVEQEFPSKAAALSSLRSTMDVDDIKPEGTLEKDKLPPEVLSAYESKTQNTTKKVTVKTPSKLDIIEEKLKDLDLM